MRVIDSVGWIEYLRGGPLADEYYEHLRDADQVITPAIVIYEVYKRTLIDADRRAAAVAVAQMLKTHVVPLDTALAVSAAEKSAAHKLAMADAIVYATALSHGAVVVTSDKHFRDLPQVIFISPEGED